MIERSFSKGALKKEDFHFETNNKETMVFFGPDGTKRSLMCLPGSVRVSQILSYFANPRRYAPRVCEEEDGWMMRGETQTRYTACFFVVYSHSLSLAPRREA
jgi:hypothetical protein